MKKIDHPLLSYLIIAFISFICSIVLFQLGGSLAEATGNQENLLGFSFKAGGAIAGFLIIFWFSQSAILKFYDNYQKLDTLINIKVYLQGQPQAFSRNDQSYQAQCTIFNEDSGDSKSFVTQPFWEAGFLTVMIKDVGEKDYLTIKISNANNIHWESDYFHSRSPKLHEVKQLN